MLVLCQCGETLTNACRVSSSINSSLFFCLCLLLAHLDLADEDLNEDGMPEASETQSSRVRIFTFLYILFRSRVEFFLALFRVVRYLLQYVLGWLAVFP